MPPKNSKVAVMSRRGLMEASVGLATGCGMASCATHAAMGAPAIGDKGYAIKPIGDGLYWLTDGGYSTMFAVDEAGVIAFDAPPTLGTKYLKAIAEVTDKPVRYLVYSHEHVDHIAASHIFPATTKVVANAKTAELLASRRDSRRRLPDIVFDKAYSLELGKQRFDLSYLGINHCFDNTFIFSPQHRVLMLIDVIYPGWMPYKNLGVAVDVPGFVEAHRQVLAFDFETLIAGHVSRPGTREDVSLQLAFLHDLCDASLRAYEELPFGKFLAATPSAAPNWDRHNDYEIALVDRVAAAVAPKWRSKLLGFDTYFRDNCWAMLETIVVQGTPQF